MTKDEALKLALEALEKSHTCPLLPDDCAEAITAIKEALAQPEPWEKFCDSNCVWTDHHSDCKLAEQHQDWCASLTQMLMSMPPKPAPCNCKPEQEPVATDWERIARVQDAKLRAMCNEAGGFEKLCEVMDKYERTTLPQRKPLTDAELERLYDAHAKYQEYGAWVSGWFEFARAIEAAHGIKGEA